MSCDRFLCGKFTAKVSLLLPMSCGYRAALFSDKKATPRRARLKVPARPDLMLRRFM